jgi:NADPH:quinone reductase-like Zn-dependent oxidoreductase
MVTMKAVRIHTYGDSSVLMYEDAPRPIPGEGEVLLRVHATTVNPFDCAVRAGYVRGYFNHALPLILGSDVSGVIEDVGANANGFSPGQEVYTRAGIFRDGANAEYVLASAADLASKPHSLDHIQAAALPHVVLTAWQALYEVADLHSGQTVLIHGAAGGVGHVAVQLAKARGAHVIGTASQNIGILESLGVDEALDYTATPFEQVARQVDVVLDTIGGETQARSWATLKPGGILISTVQPPAEETAAAHEVRQAMIASAPPIGPTLAEAARMVEQGALRPVVSFVLPLSEIRKAHQMVEGRHTCGKIVLDPAL